MQREAAGSGTHRVSNYQYARIMAEEAGEVRLWLEGHNPGAEPGPATAAVTDMGADVETERARPYEAGVEAAQAGAAPGLAVIDRKRAGETINAIIKPCLLLRHNNDPRCCPSLMASSESGRLR